MSHVFISYSHEDREVARRYASALEAAGLAVWWDDHLRSGEAFDEKIEAALRAASAVVVLWSKTSLASISPALDSACTSALTLELRELRGHNT